MTDNESGEATRRIAIPEETAEAIEERLPLTEFESADAYAAFALSVLIRELEQREDGCQPQMDCHPAESEEVQERLETLGYL